MSFHKSIPETEKRAIISRALFAVGEKSETNEDNFLNKVCALEKEYLKISPKNYVLTTSISLNYSFPLKKVYINNTILYFTSWLPRSYNKAIKNVFDDATHSLVSKPPTNYLHCRVYLKAKSHHGAADEALRNLDIIRGIWNWYFNRKKGWGRTYGIRKPMNPILLGPLHFIHYPRGKLTNKVWWFDRDCRSPVNTLSVTEPDGETLIEFYKLVRNKLARHKYRKIMEEVIIRYNRALDEWNWDNAFIKLWNILEFLTGSIGANNKKVVDRLLFFSGNRKYDGEILNTLRLHRNSFIHESRTNESIEAYVYELKNWVEHMMWFHLLNPCDLKSPAEGTQLFDLPSDKEVLKKRMELVNYALKLK